MNFADLLHNAQLSSLADQRGITIDDLHQSFQSGERQALQLSQKNNVKRRAYDTAYENILNLRNDLTALADEGNRAIEEVAHSEVPEQLKVAQISSLIQHYRALASLAAAKYGSNIIDAMQEILTAEGLGQSAREFARGKGVDIPELFRRRYSSEKLESEVSTRLREPSDIAGIPDNQSTKPNSPAPTQAVESKNRGTVQANLNSGSNSVHMEAYSRNPNVGSEIPINSSTRPRIGSAARQSLAQLPLLGSQGGGASTPVSVPDHPRIPSAAATSVEAPAPLAPSRAAPIPSISGAPTPPISPTELAQSFNKGMESGAPLSAAAHAVPSTPITSTEPPISHAAQTIPTPTVNSQVHVPVTDAPPPTHHAPPPEAPPPTPIVAAPQPISPPQPPQPVGPLPTYGSDLRPPLSTAVTPPAPANTPLPPPATPTSAPVTPSAGQSAANQPAVVRQTTSSTPPSPPSTPGTQAVAATATGAALGTASADNTARKRLQRLVTAVARQQPRLAWAAGDHTDNTTLLVTDLAGGWIPPGIELPSAVSLLPPARRCADLEALLGAATVTASYTPLHHLSDDGDPIPTSTRPRSAPDVKDLGWELSQATQWRDGLPRLAHTLAKAASAGTGVLDSEIDLLTEHLGETSKRVLDSYPDNVDTHDVGNWQLLAAIDALVAGDKAAANYHLAWFLAAKTGDH
ncbi:DUF5631 domain-containing protein [Mycobacterium camsae]|uniref:DUF5631 domain-containing protein n=1 Tax=Mycobacterium gordonae TaxID=1778 RepID=UPI001980F009|nr:DUF5631 domain-containing protein [Mycobacterium gordonae]